MCVWGGGAEGHEEALEYTRLSVTVPQEHVPVIYVFVDVNINHIYCTGTRQILHFWNR